MAGPVLRPSPDAIIRLRGHPGFAAAARAAANSSVTLYRSGRVLNALLSDRARALFSYIALYLHFADDRDGESGLTAGAIKEMCVRLGLCSRGRCEAMLALMRAVGFLVAAPHADRRRRPLVPTEKLMALHRERWGGQFDAMSLVMPAAVTYQTALNDQAFVETFVLELGRRFIAGLRVLDDAPELAMFAERNAGMMVLFSLALAGPVDEGFPPSRPVPLSINALATKFSVSRKHVLTLLRDAEGQGLLRRGGIVNDEITILPRGREAVQNMLASMFLYLAECAEMALRAAGTHEPDVVAMSGMSAYPAEPQRIEDIRRG